MIKFSAPATSICYRVTALLLLLVVMLLAPVHPVEAQEPQVFDITIKELGSGDRVLQGPVAQTSYYFGLPADWDPQPGGYLELDFEYAVVGQEDDAPTILEVQLNGNTLHTEILEAPAELQVRIDIPTDTLLLFESPYLNDLQLSLESFAECKQALRAHLTVLDSSLLHFVYQAKSLVLDLADYPKPIYQRRSVRELNQARFVLPPDPGGADIRTAAIVAAGLGKLTSGNLALAASLATDLAETTELQEHLLVIGQPESNPLVRELELPLPTVERQLSLHSKMPATVVPGQAFTLTLVVENTSSTSRDLALEDHWSPGSTLLSCQGRCEETTSNVLRWEIGQLGAGAKISTSVQVLLDASTFSLEERVEHTASLLDGNGNVINVDTLAAEVGPADDGQWVASSPEKGTFFFAHDGRAVAENDGVIQEIVSPWSDRHAILVITGLDDESVLLAGQALAAGNRLPGMSGTFAIVQAVQPVSETMALPVEDMPLASLEYTDNIFDPYESVEYVFRVPRGWTLAEDPDLFVHFTHSATLNAISATLELGLNWTPITSIVLDEHNAEDTWQVISLPRNRLEAGINRLRVQLIADFPECMDPSFAERFWATLYADSFLRLSYDEQELVVDLADLPRPFSYQNDLGDIVFLLPERPVMTEIGGLLNLVSRLGNVAGGDYFAPRVVLGGDPKEAKWDGYHLVALGRPTSNSYIAAANDILPYPFVAGTDEIRQQVENVIYRLPPGYSLGFVQELISPWDQERALLVVTGTTDEGVAWALDALTNAQIRYRLAGNLVVIAQEGDLRITDTREPAAEEEPGVSVPLAVMTPEATVTPTPTPTPTATPTLTLTPTPIGTALATPVATVDVPIVVTQRQPIWLIPLLVVSVLIVVVCIVIVIWRASSTLSK